MKLISLSSKFIILLVLLCILLIVSGCQDKKSPESRLENPDLEVKIGNSVYTKLDVYNHIYTMLKPFIDKSAFFVRWPRNFKFNCWILGLEDVDFKMEIENKFSALLNSIPLKINGNCYDYENETEFIVLIVKDIKAVFNQYSFVSRIVERKGKSREEFEKKYKDNTFTNLGIDNNVFKTYLRITNIKEIHWDKKALFKNRVLSSLYSGIVPYVNNIAIIKESIFSNNDFINYQPFDIALLKAWYSDKIKPGISLNKAAYKLTNEVMNYFEMETKNERR